MSNDTKKRETFYITHSIELLIWTIIILVFVAISTSLYTKAQKEDNDYNIFMPDVDGLIVGSPVRIMGIEVGYVTEIKPTTQEVFVRFLIKDKNMHIPQGTVATVEFTGMAGSKSLELYLPQEKIENNSDVPIISVQSPKRLHDALGLLNEMFEKIGAIIYTTSSFGQKLNNIEIQTGSTKDAQKFLDYTTVLVDETNDKAEKFGDSLEKYSVKLKEKKHGKTQP